jgi:hypothetical protein
MTATENLLNNNALTALVRQAAPRVVNAIRKASAATGVSFAYMLQKASAESGFDSTAKSHSSSATGLFQFIDKTWISMVKKYGAKCGLGHYASCIDDNGHIADPAVKQQILALRKNPDASAMMAAEYASENKAYMQEQLPGTKIGTTELNLAHFLGAGGATAFMKAYQENPLQQASDLFPKAANVNRNVFYDAKTGTPRTLAGIYDYFAGKPEAAHAPAPAPAPATTVAAAPVGNDTQALASTLMAEVDSGQPTPPAENARVPASSALPLSHGNFHWSQRTLPATPSANAMPMGGLIMDPARVMLLAHQETHTRQNRTRDVTEYSRLNT